MTWKKVKLLTLLTLPIQNGYSPICPETSNGKWILGLGALNGSGLDVRQIKPAPINDSRVDDFLLQAGDFLVSRSNTLDKVGRAALFKGQIKNCSYPDLMMRFRVDESRIHKEFLDIYLRSSEAIRAFQRSASGTSGSMVKINKCVLENLLIPLPNYKEQIAIADVLLIWDHAIEKTEQLIVVKKKRFAWLLVILINKKNKKNWRKTKLEDLALIQKGQQLNISHMIDTGKYYALNGGIEPSGFTNSWNTQENTITISEGGNSCGFVSFNTQKFWCGGHCYALNNIRDVIEKKYLYYFLKLHEKQLMSLRVGSGLPNIQKKDLQSFHVSFPSLIDQNKITKILDNAKQEIDLLKKQLNAYGKQKRGLTRKLLTGQWRVNQIREAKK